MIILFYTRSTAFILLLALILMFTGCATIPSQSALNVRDADMKMVENCRFLGDVAGSSGWGNLAASTGMQNAKNEAKDKAAALGATHIVWTIIAGGYSPFVNGKAYSCKQ